MRAVIFANGNISDRYSTLTLIHKGDLLIAADGGARHCQLLGLTPNYVIGDLDSIDPQQMEDLRAKGVRFITYPRDKDQTDLELALDLATSKGAQEIHLLGLLGGRIDQTLANLLLLARDEWRSARLSISDGQDSAYLLRSGEHLNIQGKPGDTISLIPLSALVIGITTHDLRWELSKSTLKFGSTLGISNEMLQPTAYIEITDGKLLVIHRKVTMSMT